MVLREPNDPLNQSRGIMGPLENSAVQNNRGRLRQRFDLIRKLGQGTYGKVQLGIDKETGQEVAIKTIKKSKIETEADLIRIRREIQIMSSVRHPNIIHIYEVFENREKMVLVMEYAAGGELYDYLNDRKILQEDEARRIFRQIASAVYYCHKHKICHRDLKLENILLDEKSNAKIADFGLSNVFDDLNLLKTFCGSPLYASPEIVRGTPYYGPEVDCWSLGVLLYTLVYGAMPFDGSNFKRLVKQISNGDYYEPKKPAEASLLIKLMLTVDPVKRASIKDVCAHQWINHGFDKVCLNTAEELANQTPVRLDLLLSLAPAYNINHSQVVIACDQNETGAAAGAAGPGPSSEALPGPSEKKDKHHSQHQQQQQESKTSSKSKKHSESQPHDEHGPGKGDRSKPSAAAVAPFEKPARTSLTHKDRETGPPSPSPSKVPPTIKQSGEPVKRKAPLKKKSKSSPVLELIVDEEENELEEKRRLEDIIDGAGEDDDDAGDTLSEISEIQTIAEDIKDVGKSKSKGKVKEEAPVSTTIKKEEEQINTAKPSKVEKVEKQPDKATIKAQPSVPQESKEKLEKEKQKTAEVPITPVAAAAAAAPSVTQPPPKQLPEVVESKPKVVVAKLKEKAPEKPKEEPTKIPEKEKEKEVAKTVKEKAAPAPAPAPAPASVPVPAPVSVPEPVKQSAKPKSTVAADTEPETPATKTTKTAKSSPAEPATPAESTATPATTKPPTVKKKIVKQKAVTKDKDKEGSTIAAAHTSSATGSSSSVASSAGGKSGSKLDKETSSTSSASKPKLRPRSDSANSSDASPTRIERRSSKIISQKTAELIQNLETKTSTSSTDSLKPKKLLFPSLKVSDAKRAFEKPPKPLKEPTPLSSSSSKSQASAAEDKPKEKIFGKKEVVQKIEKEKPELEQLAVSKPKKQKSKSPSPSTTGTEEEDNNVEKKAPSKPSKEVQGIVTKQQTEPIKTVTAGTGAAQEEKEKKTDVAKPLKKPEAKETGKVSPVPPVVPAAAPTATAKAKPSTSSATPTQEIKAEIVVKTPSTLVPPGSTDNLSKPKSRTPSPKPDKKTPGDPVPKPSTPKAAVKTLEKVPVAPMSPEPDTDTMTVSDDLNTEIDLSISEFSMTEPTNTKSKSAPAKPQLKKLKITAGVPNSSLNEQLVKPVMVDSGNGPPKQAVMLVSGKTTPPVKQHSADLDSCSMSTDGPFFSQTESVSASIPKDNKKILQQQQQPSQKEQAAKKISSVISKIASSESTDRLLKDGKPKNQGTKTIKTEVEKFVNTPETPGSGKQFKTQRSEVSFPVAAAPSQERIIPIKFISDDGPPSSHATSSKPQAQSASAPNISRPTLQQKKMDGPSSSIVFSRQNSSDTESSIAGPLKAEPIRKSPREFIIPIKLEHSGQTLTPKEDVSEAGSVSEDPFRMDSRLRSGRFGRHKRYSSLLSDSSLEEEPVSVSATASRRSSAATAPSHARSHSQGDEPDTPTTPLGTFKRYRMRRAGAGLPLDRSDSFSSAEEDEEDAFEVLTAESLFSSLLDRVRNLTKRLNRDDGPTPNWPGPESPSFGLWGNTNPLREFMSRAPSETRSYASSGPGNYTMTRSFSREPSVTVTISSGPGWRRSLSREMSGDSDSASAFSEPQSAANPASRSKSGDNHTASTASSSSSNHDNNDGDDENNLDDDDDDDGNNNDNSDTNDGQPSQSKSTNIIVEHVIPIKMVQTGESNSGTAQDLELFEEEVSVSMSSEEPESA